MDFAGEFEVHVTLAPVGDLDALARWAGRRGVKFAHIVLDGGVTPSQPMLTLLMEGTVGDARGRAVGLAAEAEGEGYRVVRIKVEASPWNRGVPATGAEVHSLPAGLHFEHHVKLHLMGQEEVEAVRRLVEPFGGHVSRNARRSRGEGEERFVTQRCYGVPLGQARERLEALLGALRAHGARVLEVEQEYVVHDSNEAVDAGWIRAGEIR